MSAAAPAPSTREYKGRLLGRILIKMGKVNRTQVHEALGVQKTKRGPLGQILIDLGYITEADLKLALAAQIGMEPINLDAMDVQADVIKLVPNQMANTYRIIPVAYDSASNTLSVAIASPDNFQATDDLQKLLGYNIRPMIASEDQITTALNRYYPEGSAQSINDLLTEIGGDAELSKFQGRGESIDLEELKELVNANPVKQLLNLVLLRAIQDHSSDIHFEPFENEYKLRYRIDGVLYEMVPPQRFLAMAIASRIKVMANLDIAERRLPQDGRISLTVAGNPVDLRVAVLPTMFGESVVLRILDRSNVQLDLDRIGLREDDLNILKQLINRPHGIIINTGPTGSGKTTTLYACLNHLNTPDTKILTAEDPVEYDIDGIIQCQVNVDTGMTFARALRSFLRQDPDVILVGEIRDLETAQIAIQSSLTGHLVFSTLHTNDAPSAVARLLDLGVEPFLITATFEAVVAQRLARRICKNCKQPYTPTPEQLMELQLRPEDVEGRTFYFGAGCDYCNGTGYRGRVGIFETMVFNEEIRDLVMNNASTGILREAAQRNGMRTLRESGLLAIYDGITTIEEVVKETVLTE
ncbi:MAG: type IV fimbrial assembly protein PilB [Phycisphaerae bacterium]|nr:MAG: Flp pilus assembly complex ATPase component TadA [Planctomycetia bacterium]RIK67749.1 MAG: pilus assembly protein PilB [Planctomycetota bacterium]GJQ26676.1 MAG: type IV fimbrial assembly protein PilB [Phycisphaerae bacterium]